MNDLCKKQHTKQGNVRKRTLLSILILFGTLTGMLWISGVTATAFASEATPDSSPPITDTKSTIQISEFGVSQEEDGIFAYCIYQEFDENDGMIQLYLEKMDQEGNFTPISYADLYTADNDPKTAKTSPTPPEPGIYKAVLLARQDASKPVVRFRDSDPYEVKETGKTPNDPQSSPDSSKYPFEEPLAARELEDCDHLLIENILRNADPSHDEVLAECCKKCGQVFACYEVPNSAYAAFLADSENMIRNALPDSFVVIRTDRWVSFNEDVLNTISRRRDLSILIRYQYQGREQQTFIPFGADTTKLADENGFCGFCRMAELLL